MSELTSLSENDGSPGPQVVPQSREAEEAVIGAVLINPEAYYDVAQFLQADDFYIHRHRWIWQAFNRLHERRVPLDFLTVSEELDQQNQLAEVGGTAYLTALINNVPEKLGLKGEKLVDYIGWLAKRIETLKTRPGHVHVVLTGRRCPPELVVLADTVTEMQMVKHAFKAGIPAQRGIED